MATTGCLVVMVAMVFLVAGAGGQTQDCTPAYNYLTTCLSYVSGNDTAPSAQCCSGISYLNANDADCLCQIVNQFNSSNTPGVNATKAFALPALCGVVVDTAKCPALALALAPGAAVAPTPPLLAPPAGAGPSSSPPTSAAAPHTDLAVALTAVLAATHFLWNALTAT